MIQLFRKKNFNVILILHLHMGLPCWFSGKKSACNAGATGDMGLILSLGRCPGEGNKPLQCPCENLLDRGSLQVTVHGVTELDTTEQPTLSHTFQCPRTGHGGVRHQNWSGLARTVDLQRCVSFRCAANWFNYTYTCIYSFSDSFAIEVITEYYTQFPGWFRFFIFHI